MEQERMILTLIILLFLPPLDVAVRVEPSLVAQHGSADAAKAHVYGLISGLSETLRRQSGVTLRLVHIEYAPTDSPWGPAQIPCDNSVSVMIDLIETFDVEGADVHVLMTAIQTGCALGWVSVGYVLLPQMGQTPTWDRQWFGHEVGHVLGADHIWKTIGGSPGSYGTFMDYPNDDPNGPGTLLKYHPASVLAIQESAMGVGG